MVVGWFIGEVDAEGQCRKGDMISNDCNGILPLPISRLVRKHPRHSERREHHLQKAEMAQSSERHHLRQKMRSVHPFRSAIHNVSGSLPAGAALRHDHKTIRTKEHFPRVL